MTLSRRTFQLSLAAAGAAAASRAFGFPDKAVRIIIPVAAGGSTDLVARVLQATIDRMKGLPQPLAIVNNGAAGGTVGTRMIKDAEPDGHTIGFWHMGLLTAPAMGVVDYDHTAFSLLAQVGSIQIGLGVREDSPFRTLKDIVDAAKAKPDTVTVATNIGLLPHFVPLMLASETGTRFRFVQSGGGAVRLKSIAGGHTQVSLFSVPELVNFKASGIRPIAVFADKRHPALPDVPSIGEAGFKTTFEERTLIIGPKGIAPERVRVLNTAFKAALDDADVVKRFQDQGVERVFYTGDELRASLDQSMVRVKAVAEEVRREQEAAKKQ